ncbi:hypothetical protein NHX12_021611 [Muraenolepis orangiensis]|uniref:Uncharacterized protein n=1 Tax=Muraenolepis orangiensis TaxID=630683 RepID=A0A9Q0ETH9_9TELE|nr:hypothetical protein NHX12_021611 [Muraenolepis orangiensis]
MLVWRSEEKEDGETLSGDHVSMTTCTDETLLSGGVVLKVVLTVCEWSRERSGTAVLSGVFDPSCTAAAPSPQGPSLRQREPS